MPKKHRELLHRLDLLLVMTRVKANSRAALSLFLVRKMAVSLLLARGEGMGIQTRGSLQANQKIWSKSDQE